MKQRIITGAILVIVLGLFIYFGEGELEFLFSGLCVVLSSLAAFEFSRMLNKGKKFSVLNYLSIPFTFVFTLLSVFFFQTDFFYMIVFVFIISILL
jgi:CDP-diglyceride synthetase